MITDKGVEEVRQDPIGFARMQWNTWSPDGWFDGADFAATAESFLNPDRLAITLHSYRSRWKDEEVDVRYARKLKLRGPANQCATYDHRRREGRR
jgi:hypothetical protein